MTQTSFTTTIQPSSVTNILPASLKKFWRVKTSVLVSATQDSILIKKAISPSQNFQTLDAKLKKIGRQIKQKDITEAIKWARNEV